MFNDYSYLYVEDDPPSRQVMQLIMESMGIERLSVFEDSSDFLARVRALGQVPDIVLLDIQIAPYDGFEMIGMLRSEPEFAGLRVIALTASVMNEEVERLKQSGFNGAIAKPLDFRAFPDLIERVINGEPVWHIS